MTFDVGTAYTATFQVTNASGQPVIPASASLAVTQPDQTPFPGSPFTVTPASPLQQVYVPAQPGLHQMVWTITGPTVVKTDWENFRNFRSIVSLTAARNRLTGGSTLTDEKLRDLMGAATREVEKVTGILVPTTFTNELIPGTYRDALRVQHGPILMPPSNTQSNGSVTSLKSAYPSGPSWPAGGTTNELLVTPSPGVIRHVGLIPFWYGPWLVTYTGGVQYVEEWAEQACLEVLFEMWQQMRGLTADLMSDQMQGLPAAPWFRMPARALALLDGHEMPGFG